MSNKLIKITKELHLKDTSEFKRRMLTCAYNPKDRPTHNAACLSPESFLISLKKEIKFLKHIEEQINLDDLTTQQTIDEAQFDRVASSLESQGAPHQIIF